MLWNVVLYFIQLPWYITHYLFSFSPYFPQGIWSSNSLGKPWQGCKARIYGSADGTCAVTFAPSGIFSSGKSICKTHEYTCHRVTGLSACRSLLQNGASGAKDRGSQGTCSPWSALSQAIPILVHLFALSLKWVSKC